MTQFALTGHFQMPICLALLLAGRIFIKTGRGVGLRRGDEILQVNQEVLRSWMDASSLPGSLVVKRDGALVEIIVRGSGLGRTTGHRARSDRARTSRGVIRFLRHVSHRLRVSA